MTDWLLLRVPQAEDEAPVWAQANDAGQLLSMPSADPTGIAAAAVGRRVALIVPAADVSLLQTVLPAANEARLLQLAPFALEDQVSQDVDDLHFAVGHRDGDTGMTPVAVVDRTRLQQWLARAAQWQVAPNAVFAESDLAPVLPGHVTMMLLEDQLLLRHGAARPLLMPASDPQLALEILLPNASDLTDANLSVFAAPSDWQQYAKGIEVLRDSVASYKVQLSAGGALALMAPALNDAAPINLLQGAFRPKVSGGQTWEKWRWVAALAGALLLLHGIASWWELRQLRKASADSQAEINQLLANVFAGQPPPGDARRNMEARLTAVAGGAGQPGDLLNQLAALAAAKQNVPVVEMQSFNFKPGTLQMKLTAPDAATLEQFSVALRAGGYTSQVTAGNLREGKYEGQVDLRSPGS
jgi:general secretion pathway protein L